MHTVIITFTLTDMSPRRYREVSAELAPAFAELPGLLAKVWLSGDDTGEYGGVYLFTDTDAADRYLGSALYRTVRDFPHFAGVTVRRYAVDETTTRRTQPGIALVGSAPATV